MDISPLQEMQLTGDTSVGVAYTDGVTECAAVTEDENEDKIWTITAFGEYTQHYVC